MTSTGGIENSARREGVVAVAVVAVHALILLYFAVFRYVDGDEGFYLSAASQVAKGRTLYTDFFFPQMPFLPWVQSLVSGHGFDSLYYSRMLGLTPAILTPVALYVALRNVCERRTVRLIILLLYCFSGLFLVWHSVAKTYAWTDLWLMLLFLNLMRGRRTNQIGYWLAAGVSFALAVNFRSVLVVTIIPVAYAWESMSSARRWAAGVAFLAAAAVISLPSLRLLLADPARFYFNNLGYHFIRNPGVTFVGAMIERGMVVGKFLLIPQIWVVVVGLIVTWRLRRVQNAGGMAVGRDVVLAWLMAGAISLVYVLPSPVHLQYFEQALGFGLIGAAPGFAFLLNPERSTLFGLKRSVGLILIGVVYLATLIPFAAVFLGTIRTDNRSYSVRNITELCQYVNAYPATGPLLSEWPGVTALSGRDGTAALEFVGFQNQFPLTESQLREYNLPVSGDLRKLLEAEIPAVYVVWNAPDTALADVAWKHYHIDREFDQFKVLVRNEASK